MVAGIVGATATTDAGTSGGISLPIGVAMMILGGTLTILAAWRYHVVNRNIEHGKVSADRGLVVLVTVMVTLLSGAMIVFALLSAKQP